MVIVESLLICNQHPYTIKLTDQMQDVLLDILLKIYIHLMLKNLNQPAYNLTVL